jgi:hypothetical protein
VTFRDNCDWVADGVDRGANYLRSHDRGVCNRCHFDFLEGALSVPLDRTHRAKPTRLREYNLHDVFDGICVLLRKRCLYARNEHRNLVRDFLLVLYIAVLRMPGDTFADLYDRFPRILHDKAVS